MPVHDLFLSAELVSPEWRELVYDPVLWYRNFCITLLLNGVLD
jgi:hypothetical protein